MTGSDLAILPGRADLPLVQNQIELLRSGNVLAKVIEAQRLHTDPEFSGSRGFAAEHDNSNPAGSPRQTGDDNVAYSATLDALNRKLGVRQVGTSHMVTVSFKASDPEKAARIVNSVIHAYLQELTRASDSGSSRAPALRELYQSLGPSAHLISEAEPPVRADGPAAILIIAGAALFGLTAAAVAAILLDAMNDTIRSAQQMEYVLGLECLGVIRRLTNIDIVAEDAAAQRLQTSEQRILQGLTATMLDASLRGLRIIGVTSTLPGEGVTTLAIALAQTLAISGKRVLLIDSVAGNPSLSRWVAHLPGVSTWPIGESGLKALSGLVRLQVGLHVLPFPESREGDASSMRRVLPDQVLSSAADSYDLVIVDMPSFVAGPDVRSAASLLDGILLVVKWDETESELVRQGFQSTGEARPKFIGAVLNMADEETMRCYGCKLPAELKVVTAS